MPQVTQHLEQARSFHHAYSAQEPTAQQTRVILLHLVALHLVDTRLAQLPAPIHPSSHKERNELLRSRPTAFHGVPRKAVNAYIELLMVCHEIRYECPNPHRTERLHQSAIEEFDEVKAELESVGVYLEKN
jgi:hypothetical protein